MGGNFTTLGGQPRDRIGRLNRDGTQDTTSIDRMSRASEEGRIWDIDSEERFGDTRSQNVLEEMFAEFRRVGASIQAVDIGGLRSTADVGFGSSRATSAGAATRRQRALRVSTEAVRVSST